MADSVEFSRVKYSFMFVAVLLLLSQCLKQGGASRSLSKDEQVDEDFEIEKQLKILNKPSIKTIHTEWGDIIDCIDINKQPALDHPLLKDHKVQLKPSSPLLRDGTKSKSSRSKTQSDYEQSSIFDLPKESCPKGTVPIRRTSKEDLVRAKSLQTSFEESKYNFDGQRLAGLIYNVSGEPNHGVAGVLSVYNPTLTNDEQFSSSEIAIENGPQNQINGIRVGWTVNPQLFGDKKTRIFTLWTTDSYQKTGCYNALCSGFVQVHDQVTPGCPINPISVYHDHGKQFAIPFQLYQDFISGDWWVVVPNKEEDESKDINIGYWPKNLFSNLNGGWVYWGGHVKASVDGIFPEMGNGHAPTISVIKDYSNVCYYKQMKYVDSNNTLLNPKEDEVTKVLECGGNTYGVQYYGFQRGDFGHTFEFGGHGGQCTQ